MPVRVCHVITGLEIGGAETMLAKLCEALPRDRVLSSVVALRSGGPTARRIRDSGTPLTEIGLRPGRLPGPMSLRRLRRSISQSGAQLVQGWMYHANVAASLAGGGVPVLWNVRQTLYDIRRERVLTRAVIRTSAWLSGGTAAILYNSSVAARQHASIGFRSDRAIVLPNGFDVSRFAPSFEARRDVRAELGLGPDAGLVGLIARAHPMKDHKMFFEAATRIAMDSDTHFLLVGDGTEALSALVPRGPLGGRVHALGPRSDLPRITAALDVACSTSAWGEGFPNVLGEALACGVPCVATDVGDSADVIGTAGRVVKPGDAWGFASAVTEIMSNDQLRRQLGTLGRERVVNNYSLDVVANRYAALYERFAAEGQLARNQ